LFVKTLWVLGLLLLAVVALRVRAVKRRRVA
jgi:hypothetical protein